MNEKNKYRVNSTKFVKRYQPVDVISKHDENEYISYMDEISDKKIEEIMECDDLENQIESYLDIVKKIESCKKHLTSKKMKIVTQK